MTPGMARRLLEPDRIVGTVEALHRRVSERFPKSGLREVCGDILAVGRDAKHRSDWIARPILSLRIGGWALVALIAGLLVATLFAVDWPDSKVGLLELIQTLEAGINEVVLIGVGIFFLFTLERRIKRRRALRAIHELRSIAHIIDMHQLTKDPEWVLWEGKETTSSPKRLLSPFELSRYLDYCSEMLSLTGKIAALYIQDFDDSVVLAAANEVESLTTGLSRKVWQKLMILNAAKR